jgi:ankyrin repeat protein
MEAAIASIHQSQLELFKSIIRESSSIMLQHDIHSRTLLHFAAEAGRFDFLRHILEALLSLNIGQRLVDILNAQSKMGFTAMMLAAEQGNEEIVDYLLREGARSDITSLDGRNALDIAAHSGYASLADLLNPEWRSC